MALPHRRFAGLLACRARSATMAAPAPPTRSSTSMIPRLFTPLPLTVGAAIELDAAAAHHALRVLRLGPGAAVELFDGKGGSAAAILFGKAGEVRVERLLAAETEPALRLTLAQCISASEKMDWTIEKAVELGATELVPLQSQKAIVRLTAARSAKRLEHWQRLILAASAQSGRNRVPRLEEVKPIGDWLAARTEIRYDKVLRIVMAPDAPRSLSAVLAAHETGALTDTADRPGTFDEVCLLCGPESGLSRSEYLQACAAGWLPAGLGPRVLRTETAGMVALAVVQSRWGDLR